jgi:hypothetical protein
MRYLICLILCLLFVPELSAAQIKSEDIDEITIQAITRKTRGETELVISDDPPNLNAEMAVALADLAKIPEQERSSMKYFTLYAAAHDADLLTKLYQELIFWCNSLSAESFFSTPMPVEGSATLFRVDIRDYGWTEEAWEKMAVQDPYTREPWINFQLATDARLESGNILIRADWFIDATSSPVKQLLLKEKDILYYTLLYAKWGVPKNLDEYRAVWGIDKAKIEGKLKTIKQILIAAEESGVTSHNRILAVSRIELGYEYESSDFKTSNGKQNVLDNLEPGVFAHSARDAGEQIGSLPNGLQRYFISDKQNNRLDEVDAKIAHDDTQKEPVIQIRSCVTCHAQGINAANSGVKDALQRKISLYTANKEEYLKHKRAYGRNMEADMALDSDRYDAAVQECNGLTAKDNAVAFQKILDWYNSKLDAAQCARECGVTTEEYIAKIQKSPSLTLLRTATGGKITRGEWENPKGGYFAQAMLTIMGVDYIPPQETEAEQVIEDAPVEPQASVLYVQTTLESRLMSGKQTITLVPKGTLLKVLAQQDLWYRVEFQGKPGWLHKQDLIEELK